MFRSNLGDPVYTCMLCASRSKVRLITGIKTRVFKNKISCLVQADLRSGEQGCSLHDLPLSYPSSRTEANLGDDGHVALGTS